MGLQARARAIKRLGHPKIANKHYKKIHITKFDETILRGLRREGMPSLLFVCAAYIVFFILGQNFFFFPDYVYVLGFAPCFFGPVTIVPWIAKFSWKSAMWMDMTFTAILFFLILMDMSGSWESSAIVVLVSFLPFCYFRVRLVARKLEKFPDEWEWIRDTNRHRSGKQGAA